MIPIEASDADRAQLKVIVRDFVLKRWVERCGKQCAVDWDNTIGKVLGMKAEM